MQSLHKLDGPEKKSPHHHQHVPPLAVLKGVGGVNYTTYKIYLYRLGAEAIEGEAVWCIQKSRLDDIIFRKEG